VVSLSFLSTGFVSARGAVGKLKHPRLTLGRVFTWDRQLDHRLRKVFIERDVPVEVLLAGERYQADRAQFLESGETKLGGFGIAYVAEGREDMGVLLAA
jgi:hypothetical protein